MNARDAQPFDAIVETRRLLRRGGTAALATLTGDAPLTTLVAVASDFDGAPLMLLSTLSVHTRNLIADPRSSLLLATAAQRGDPLNQPRLTVLGRATPTPGGRGRYLARHPKAKLYASFADFKLYRLEVESVHFNGGFARAAPMTPSQLLSDIGGADDLLAAEADLLKRINAWPGLAALGAPASPSWRAFALDPDGFDLRRAGSGHACELSCAGQTSGRVVRARAGSGRRPKRGTPGLNAQPLMRLQSDPLHSRPPRMQPREVMRSPSTVSSIE